MGYRNKYIIESENWPGLIWARNVKLLKYVGWPGETHHCRTFYVCSANLKTLIPSLLRMNFRYRRK